MIVNVIEGEKYCMHKNNQLSQGLCLETDAETREVAQQLGGPGSSSRGPVFIPSTHDGAQLCISPVPGNSAPSSGLRGHCIHMVHNNKCQQ